MHCSASIFPPFNSWVGECDSESRANRLAGFATRALIDEANLTPKPGLVDCRGGGAHADMTLETMHISALSLFSMFKLIAQIAEGKDLSQRLREQVGAAGRDGERRMLVETGGCNTHRGAIWTIGLLIAGAAMRRDTADARLIAGSASRLAQLHDPRAGALPTNGSIAAKIFGVAGARGEAKSGFPHIVEIGLPALHAARANGVPEDRARLDALMAIMSSLADTCLLHRGGWNALKLARRGARMVLERGGTSTPEGNEALMRLDALLLCLGASPGGSADLLAGTLFLDSLQQARAGTPRHKCKTGVHARQAVSLA
jgi:triphosphoribosyl-dephospho-CoA synthase